MALIVVQRGHCFRTTGATGAPGEQEFTKAAADRVVHHVRALGHQVRVINADVSQALYGGDLFVALHYDSSNSPAARGASVGWQTAEGRRFSDAWKRAYVAAGWTGGFRDDNYTAALGGYYGVRRAVAEGNRRAFIAEAGFHSSPLDAALLAAPEGPDRVGRAVAAAVAEILGDPSPAQPQEDDMPLSDTDLESIRTITREEARGQLRQALQLLTTGKGSSISSGEPWAASAITLPQVLSAVQGIDVDLDPVAVAAAIPESIAQDVAEALVARLAE